MLTEKKLLSYVDGLVVATDSGKELLELLGSNRKESDATLPP